MASMFENTPIEKLLIKYKYNSIKDLPKNIPIQSIDARHRFLRSLNDYIKNKKQMHHCLNIKELIYMIISFI